MIYFIVNNFHHKKTKQNKIMKIIVPHLYTPTSLHRTVFSLVGILPDFFLCIYI